MQDVLLEPGEMVFALLVMGEQRHLSEQLNKDCFKRFQSGGVAARPVVSTPTTIVKRLLGRFQAGWKYVPTMQNVVQEPGEMVFAPGQWENQGIAQLNKNFKRFQTGGLVMANHPDTGEGWSVGKDSYGRPSVLSKPAGEAFLKAMAASKGQVKTSDITSSTRSPAKNKAVGGVPNSNHLYGNALDIHGTSKVWLKENGPKYGWKNLVYSGHDGHFDFKGGGGEQLTPAPGDGKEKTAADATPQTGSPVTDGHQH